MIPNDGFIIPARVKRVGSMWKVTLLGEPWFIKELAAELDTTGGLVTSEVGESRIVLEQKYPLFK